MKILVIGSTNIDLTIRADRIPLKGETILGKEKKTSYGGKGANQAITCGKLGADVTFLTCVGDEEAGHNVIKYLTENGVDTNFVKYSKNKSTGSAIIIVDDNGDNSIVVDQGSNLECNEEYIDSNENLFKQCDYVLLQLEIPMNAVEKAILLAHKYSKKVILNPAPANKLTNNELYKYISYITPNETECTYLTGSKNYREGIKKLLELGIGNVLVTLGENGSVLYKNSDCSIVVPAMKVKAIDTVAAGDCYNGALVAALAYGLNEKEAMEYATKASAISVTRNGAQESIPTKEELNSL